MLAVQLKPLGHGDGVLPKLMKDSVGSTVSMIVNAEAEVGTQKIAAINTVKTA